jgi:5-(carboxyamino)imidazole ribonucleotide mutase
VSAPAVEVRVGSDSDLPKIEPAFALLESLGVAYEARILSAHRTPGRMAARARELEGDGVRAVIAAAGGSAHLPGMTASETQVPVIGLPVATAQFLGVDSLLSIVQMPEGIPVGAVGVGQAAAAAELAARIVALDDPALRSRLLARAGLRSGSVVAGAGVALLGAAADAACKEAMDLLAELGVKDAAFYGADDLERAERDGAGVLIAWAPAEAPGLPASLAARTALPVVAAPRVSGPAPADGFVRLFGGAPVAAMGWNRPRNAALFAAQILGTRRPEIRERLRAYRERLADEVTAKDGRLRDRGLRGYLS